MISLNFQRSTECTYRRLEDETSTSKVSRLGAETGIVRRDKLRYTITLR